MHLTFCYTIVIMRNIGDNMKFIKQHGLLDADFVLPLLSVLVLITAGKVL